MNTSSSHGPRPGPATAGNPFLTACFFSIALIFSFVRPGHAAEGNLAGPGSVTGTVSNVVTRNLLEGARIEVPALGLRTLTDNTGRFVLSGVPAGTHELVVSYIGLDTMRSQVTVGTGQRAVRDFDLTSGIYTLQAFKVTGEREGDALAITAQRNADNVKNIVAMDSFGNLPNMSAGEVIMRLPGVAGNPSEEGLATGFNIRGMAPGLNTVTVDGGLIASIGTSRSLELQSITGTMFEQLELIKGHTPDKGADSLGGTINMKTRSTLNMREKRRLVYSAVIRIAPPFSEQVPRREEHRAHPLITLGYQEVFSVLGGERNLGISANLFYSENAVGGFRMTNQYQNTLTQPAYLWSYTSRESYNNRKQRSLNVKTEYRQSFNTKFTLNLTVNDNIERFRRSDNARVFAGTATTIPNDTSAIIPGFTDKITAVRPTTTSLIDILSNGPNSYVVETYMLDFGAEHQFGPFEIDYNVGFSRNHQQSGMHERGGQIAITNRIANIGWILDRTQSDTYPRLTQTAGADWTNPNNYRPTANGLTKATSEQPQEVPQARLNLRYKLPTEVPAFFKVGGNWREQSIKLRDVSRRWTYLGTAALAADPDARPFANLKTGMNLPRWNAVDFFTGGSGGKTPADPSLWREDLYYNEQLKYTGTRSASEEVTAGYFMAQGRFANNGWLGRTGYLTGVRMERTDTEGKGWVRTRFPSSAADQLADPVGAAARDYASTRRETTGSYTKAFPSAHLTHDITPDLKARVSWSTSFGRPAFSNLLPNETISETNQTVAINNAGLQPQTASNWDVTLDYYFEPVGNFSAGWFHKVIKDYIISGIDTGQVPSGADNGYNGEYSGFTRLTTANAGTATVRGWEFSYQQQFTFLPGLLRGLGASANYTILSAAGDFGGTTRLKTGDVAGFIPESANASLSWRYSKFSTRVLYNFTGSHIASYNAASPALNLYRYDRNTFNLGLAYQWKPSVSFTCDVANLFNEKQRIYQGYPNRTQDIIINFLAITFGVSGRF